MEPVRMNIPEHERNGMRFFAARTGAKDVVTIEGSVLGGYQMMGDALSMVPRLAADLLDAGTALRSKDTIREALAKRGASISFGSGRDRTSFSATCLPEDVPFVLELLAECLGSATFPTGDFSNTKKRTLAELEEDKTETRTLASHEFLRMTFDRTHVNYADTIESDMKRVAASARKDLLAYQKLLGRGGLVIAIVGDIAPDAVIRAAERAFSKLPEGTVAMTAKAPNAKLAVKEEKRIVVTDKANIDMYMGASVPVTYDHPQFIALSMLTSMLGGSGLFTGHLMRTIREREGLTYGIRASLIGMDGLADGALRIWATFSPATYEKAVGLTLKEIRTFLDTGLTNAMLEQKQSELTGKYLVGMGTTGGLASRLNAIGEEGKPRAYLDEYPDLIRAVTVQDLKDAASLVPWDAFSIAAAGTFEKVKN